MSEREKDEQNDSEKKYISSTTSHPSEWEVIQRARRDEPDGPKKVDLESPDGRRITFKIPEEVDEKDQNEFLVKKLANYSNQPETEFLTEGSISDLEGRKELIDSQLERLDELISEVESEKSDIGNIKQEAETLEQEVRDLKNLGSDLVEGVASASLGEQFEKRKQELEGTLRYWKAGSLASILFLISVSGLIYQDLSAGTGDDISLFLSKIVLILPASVLVWFTVSNYNRQKRLMHEYEFKKNVALSLMGFREMLENEVSDSDEEVITQFIVDTLQTVYSNPQENISQADSEESPDKATLGTQTALLDLVRKSGK